MQINLIAPLLAAGLALTAAAATPSLSTAAALSCRNTNRPNYSCPVRGTLSRPVVIGNDSGLTSLDSCRDICLTHTKCITFSWRRSGGQCIRYGRNLPQMGLKRDNSQAAVLYNRHCFSCAKAASTTTTSTSASTSSTSSTADETSSVPTADVLPASVSSTSTVPKANVEPVLTNGRSTASDPNHTSVTSNDAPAASNEPFTTSTDGSTTSLPTPNEAFITTSETSSTSSEASSTSIEASTTSIEASTTSIEASTTSIEASTTSIEASSTSSAFSAASELSTAPSRCDYSGLEYAIFSNPFSRNNDATYSSFEPGWFRTRAPADTGSAETIGGFDSNDNPMRVYDGMYTFANTFYVLDHRAYIYVPVDGNYTVHTGLHGAAIDDAVFFWTGDAALEGYSRGNALVCASFNTGYGITSTTFAAKAGYLPFRALFAQGDGGSGLTMSIVDPNGKTILESGYRSTELGDFIAHPRCSMTGRSQSFPNWGIE